MKESVPGKVDEKATQLHAIASLKVLLDATKPQRGAATSSAANHVKINLKETTLSRPNGNIDAALEPSVKILFLFIIIFKVTICIIYVRDRTMTSLKLSAWHGHQERKIA
jgi:hypothetical protein